MTTGSSSHSISTSSAASSASARVRAQTTATGSPCQQARSVAIACCWAAFIPSKLVSIPDHGGQWRASSAPVIAHTTPGWAAAAAMSTDRMRAWP